MNKQVLLTILAAFFLTVTNRAAIVYVDSANISGDQFGTSWATAYYSFDYGVMFAQPGDTIFVAKGTYQPNSGEYFTMKKDVKIFGGFLNTDTSFAQRDWQARPTILRGNNHTVIRNDSAQGITRTAVLDGFTITRGIAPYYEAGGGMYNSYASPTIINCIFIGNRTSAHTWGGGGGIYNFHSSPDISYCSFIADSVIIFNSYTSHQFGGGGAIANASSSPTITHCLFENNVAMGTDGAAIYNIDNSAPVITFCTFNSNKFVSDIHYSNGRGAAVYHARGGVADIDSCVFTNNSTILGGGGAIYIDSARLKIYKCIFQNNSSNGSGGALYISRLLQDSFIDSCDFSINATDGGGGAIYNIGAILPITNTYFSRNKSFGIGSIYSGGGAIYNDQAIPPISNCIFSENNTTVRGGALHYAVSDTYYPGNGDTPALHKCTFTKNEAGRGGAIYWAQRVPAPIDDCIFDQNVAINQYGGAILVAQQGNIKLSNCIFSSNKVFGNILSASCGAAVAWEEYSKGSVDSCIFRENSTLASNNIFGQGGALGIPFATDTILIRNSEFKSNKSSLGGAIYVGSEVPSSVIVESCDFSYNLAEGGYGGAVYGALGQISNSTLYSNKAHYGGALSGVNYPVIRCRLENNKAAYGGGIYTNAEYYHSCTLVNTLIVKNVADSFGGGMYNAHPPLVTSTTIANNQAGISGGAIYNANFGDYNDSTFTNCIIWGNNTGVFNENTNLTAFSYSLVQGLGAFPAKYLLSGTTNPQFADTLLGDYDLLSTSPCIDTGRNSAMLLGITTDYEGHARIVNDRIDLGAFEYDATRPPRTIQQPTAQSICAGTSTSFTTIMSRANSYRWQVNTGGAWTNLTNSATYSGATTTTLNITNAGMPLNGYKYRCMAYNAYDSSATAPVTLTVNEVAAPTISISADQGTSFCQGKVVVFSAAITHGGSSPAYQWQVNGMNAGADSSTYATNILADNDIVTCILTSSYQCAAPVSVNSNALTMETTPKTPVSVSIVSDQPNHTICQGDTVTFTATPVNGGTTPIYQWRRNSTYVANTPSYTASNLSNNDVIRCTMTTSVECPSSENVESNMIRMIVNSVAAPSVSITSGSGTSICAHTKVTFTATPVNGGAAPDYQWQKNGVAVGNNSQTYTDSGMTNGDIIRCILTSTTGCASTNTDTSNSITMNVSPSVTPSVTINANDTICTGTPVMFSASTVNAGTGPLYRWSKNGQNVSNAPTYNGYNLANGDVIICELTSRANCAVPATATDTITMTVIDPGSAPTIKITANTGDTTCPGGTTIFTAAVTLGGSAPQYQWRKNGISAGNNSNQYSDNAINNNDVISCTVISNHICANNATAKDSITMTVLQPATPAITIVSDHDLNTLCDGSTVIFTATPVRGGSVPQYQWKKNGIPVGSNQDTYTTNTLATGDTITCDLTSNASCITQSSTKSNLLITTITPDVTPGVSISANPGTLVQTGQSVTFTATATHGGSNPVFHWHKNNAVISGAAGHTYTTSDLVHRDQISVVMYSDAPCRIHDSSVSNLLEIEVPTTSVNNMHFTASISLYPDPNAGSFIIEGSLKQGHHNNEVLASIFNIHGQLIMQQNIPVHNRTFKQEVRLPDDMTNGIYLLRLSDQQKQSEVFKFNLLR